MGSTAAFLGVVAFVVGCAVLAAGRARAASGDAAAREGRIWAATALTVWLMLTAGLSASGVLAVAPPAMLGFFALCNGTAVVLALSPEGRRWAQTVPLWALIGFQGFRLPLEMVLHQWHAEGTVPIEMTWNGQNLDVITGIVSIAAAAVLRRTPSAAVGWIATVIGLGLLLNVMRVAVLSAPVPLPWSFHADPPLLLALHAPFSWIVSVCVAGALAGHLVAIRKLLAGGA